ncbi:glyoxalase-like protein [Herbihabitans rhizosphaerae]|uniref:Glyoxalase-like protein n=1 Tax=Herbihabitans rhizosphaerae TaxID=1872711 RepID=A0A4Q7KBW8_9PSEU|nr:VOC family protein [Herbihabitans rhizosphaerae]RZS29752.1 glyoxalase-like protein [Herbihabitans rhizosphaerae]
MIDHLVYATPDLATSTADLTTAGLTLSEGGSHVGLGTRNALADLGDGAYLEVVGPDPEQPAPEHPRPFGIDDLTAPKLLAWAVRVSDVDDVIRHAVEAGYDPGPAFPMSRRRTDGVLLEWRLTVPDISDEWRVVPFLIDWGDTPHPSDTAAKGSRLASFTVQHPRPGEITTRLTALGLRTPVEQAPRPGLVAVVRTPTGDVTLG